MSQKKLNEKNIILSQDTNDSLINEPYDHFGVESGRALYVNYSETIGRDPVKHDGKL